MTLNVWIYVSVHGFYILEIGHNITNNYARSLFSLLNQWEMIFNN